jgi:tetratricopeptide (TPR) repeat protein
MTFKSLEDLKRTVEFYKDRKEIEIEEMVILRGLEQFSQDAELHMYYALYFWRTKGDNKKANEHYWKAMELDPTKVSNNNSLKFFPVREDCVIKFKGFEDFLGKAKSYRVQEDIEAEEKVIIEGFEQFSQYAGFHMYYTLYLFETRGDNKKANEHYWKAMELDPIKVSNSKLLKFFPVTEVCVLKFKGFKDSLRRVKSYKDQKDIEAEEKAIIEGLEQLSQHTGLYMRYAVILHINYALYLFKTRGDNKKANEHYWKAMELDPTRVSNIQQLNNFPCRDDRSPDEEAFGKGFLPYGITRDFKYIKKIYDEYIEKYPSNSMLYLNYANFIKIFKYDGKTTKEARKYYDKAVEIDPSIATHEEALKFRDEYQPEPVDQKKYSSHFYNDALSEWQINRNFVRADICFNMAISYNCNNSELLKDYAVFLWYEQKDISEAEKYFMDAINVQPENIQALQNYAIFLWKEHKDYDGAEIIFKQALHVDPTDFNSHYHYGMFLAKIKGNREEASRYFQEASNLAKTEEDMQLLFGKNTVH